MLTVNKEQTIVEYITQLLTERLSSGQTVLWLISGGSAIELEAEISRRLQEVDTSNLTVALMDERYESVGHKDENWQKLLNAGFSLPQANTYRTLTGADRQETARQFDVFLKKSLQNANYAIGLFGIGTDGHTAGIKPNSPGVDDSRLVVEYVGDDFERITITTEAIKRLDEAVLYVRGHEKDAQIEKLLHEDIDVRKQPAQILKAVPKSSLFVAL